MVTGLLTSVGTTISRIHPGCPWENGYQEGCSSQCKVKLGDPNRFRTLGELVAEVHRLVYTYNHTRIHSALKMPPTVFAQQNTYRAAGAAILARVSSFWGP